MKKIHLLLFGLSAIILSCGDDEKPSYSFKHQDLSGKIGNVAWQYGDGYAEIYGMENNSQLQVDLFIELDGEGCNVLPEGDEVLFTVPNKIGVYKLKADLNDLENGHFVNLFEEKNTMNHLAARGAIEILSITESKVTGRIDATFDDESFINGNFTVGICQ